MRIVEVTKEFWFEAAHQLPAYEGPCAALHGHSYRLEVTVAGPLDEQGMVIDFADLGIVVRENVLSRLDHTFLNDLIDTPTVEVVALAVWDWLEPALPRIARVVVHETAKNRATVRANR